ncbi:MAG: hypothetical protein JNL87_21975 [Burkholderiaceae bacterium]|nr:hypothetical protein [Burkholderiaceae bacterium]
MSLLIRLTLTALAVFSLASCGGGSAEAPPLQTSGRVVEGYLSGATVLCDGNGNGVADSGEVTVTTDSGGNFTFPAPGCASGMTATGGTDVDTGIAFKGVLKAPAGATVVTPLTTLMVGGMSQERVIAALGLPAGTDIPNANPVFDPELMKRSLAVEQLLIKTTEMFAGLGGDTADATMRAVYAEVAAAHAILLQGGGTLIAGTEMDSIVVAQLVKVAAQRVALSPSVGSAVKAALAELNAESLGIATSGGLTAQAEHILKAANGAITAAATASQKDTTITEFVTDNKDLLKAAPSSATYLAGAVLTEQVVEGLGGTPEVPVEPGAPATFPISFDGASAVPFTGFNGAEGSTIEAGPADGSGKALKILRSGGEPYAGAFITTETMPLAADKKTFTARVYSPKAGIPMVLKVEGANGLSSADFQATTGVVAGWQTLTWIATGLDLSKTYNKLTLLPNLGTVDAAPGQSYYFDDINLVKDSGTTPPSTETPLPIDFDSAVPTTFGQFGAGAAIAVAAGPAGGSGNAAKFTKSAGDTWAGFFFPTATIPFTSTSRTITAKVYSPKAGAVMVMKAENGNVSAGISSGDVPATATTVVGWQTMTWVFTSKVDVGKTYNSIAIIPDSGVVGSGQAYYFDDITLVTDSGSPPSGSTETPLPINFDDALPSTLGQFGAGAAISVAAGPTGGSGNAAKFTKSAGDTWAGFYFPTATIPFSSTQRTITARVYSPKAGAVMVMKAENGNASAGISSGEVPATATTVVGWQTMTWVFTSKVDLGKTYNSIAIIPDSGVVGSGQAYYFDDVTLVTDGSVAPGPTDYLALVADTISLVNGASKTDYTMAQFESDAGIRVGWPIPSPMLMKVPLMEVGNVTLPADLKVTAGVSITETVAGGRGEIQAYIANVDVRKTGTSLEIAVPTTAPDSLAYTVSTDAKKKMVIDFGGGVKGVSATLTTAANMTNSLVFGEVVQYAINSISGQGFTGIYGLRGKYRVTVVLTGIPLRRADGSALPNLSVVVPTQLGAGGAVAASKTVTGPGLVGHVVLVD